MGQSTDAILVYGLELGEVESNEDFYQFQEKLDKGPVGLISHCSGDYPMWILGVAATQKRAWRGYPILIEGGQLPVQAEWDKLIIQTAEELGVEVDLDRIGWWLASNWS